MIILLFGIELYMFESEIYLEIILRILYRVLQIERFI